MVLSGKPNRRNKHTMDAKEMGRLGGRVRAERLTPEERKEIARRAGKASQRARRKKERDKRKSENNNYKEKG